MEDMARLALVEQSVKDIDAFSKILYELLRHIGHILQNPYIYELRTIRSNIIKDALKHDTLSAYLKYVGFKSVNSDFVYPKEQTLSNLRMAHAAIERKISFCCGSLNNSRITAKSKHSLPPVKKNTMTPIHVMTTNNPFLLKVENLFNNMLEYEDEEVQALAREHIPIVTLQMMALDRVREQQKQLKTGAIKGQDLPFDIALLMELVGWFKYKFFTWVDKPDCDMCGGPTTLDIIVPMTNRTETCQMELYKCTQCKGGGSKFPRYNDVRTLLRTRRGRCGEWANCFTLLCRALRYDARYVYDTTDHVWCEVFDYDTNSWLHVDPCEAKLNAPLMYCHGWQKKLSYVIAVSVDDLQDVTWRYTTDHKEVLKRRSRCSEQDLIQCIMTLREHRQRHVSDARRKYLAKRTLEELVQLMVERQPGDYESHGRISGSQQWRMERGEIGTGTEGHTFLLSRAGRHSVRYHPGPDVYRVACDGGQLGPVSGWPAGAHHSKNVFRKVEKDWRQVYLARQEGETTGSVSWKLSVVGVGITGNSVSIKLSSAVYENGNIDWTLAFDNEPPIAVKLGEKPTQYEKRFKSVVIAANLSGGLGDVAWQHAQLFRRSLDDKSCAFDIEANVVKC